MSNYLRREADSFVFRRRIPSTIQKRIGLKEIYRSLKTTVRRTAKARAAHLFIATERLFRMVEEQDENTLSDEDIRAAVRYWLSSTTWTNRLRHHLDDLSPGILREHHQHLPDMLLDLGRAETVSPEHNVIEEAWSALEYSDYAGLGQGETLKKTIAILRNTLKEYVDRRVQAVFEPEIITPASGAARPTAAPPDMSKISTYISIWQVDITKGYNGAKGLSEETTDQYLKTVELFIGLMGDLSVGKLTYDIAADFREKLLTLPATHGKGRTGSVKKELARAKANANAPKITMKTAKRHFSGMNSIWKWLIYKKHAAAELNPFSGHSFPGTKSKKSARDAWSTEDMKRRLTSSAYNGAPKESALHWIPLISLHGGLRLEEIGRLRPDHDLVTRDGIYCFDIKARDGWDPKTEAGTRLVPVHSWLLAHGFRDFVDAQRAVRSEYLFPELVLRKKKITAGFSREFSRIKKGCGIGVKTTFHSFRHTFRTVLESTDHKESHIDAVMGHEGGGGEGRVYTKGVTIAKLKEVVESFTLTIDLSTLASSGNAESMPHSKRVQKIQKRVLRPRVLKNGRWVIPKV